MAEDESSPSPSPVHPDTLEANRRWLKLMNAQSDIHRQTRDPRLYRQSAKKKLIAPPSKDQ